MKVGVDPAVLPVFEVGVPEGGPGAVEDGEHSDGAEPKGVVLIFVLGDEGDVGHEEVLGPVLAVLNLGENVSHVSPPADRERRQLRSWPPV